MKISTREIDDATILAPKGKISIGVGDVQLREAIDEAVNRGVRNLLLDLNGVTRMDSSGMGELIAGHKKLSRLGGNFKLVNMPPRLLNSLGASQIVSVLDVFANEAEALESLR